MMMKLRQAISIIMGANIGTSITGWILCLSYIEGTGGWATVLSTATISAIVAVVGIVLRMFSKRSVYQKYRQYHAGLRDPDDGNSRGNRFHSGPSERVGGGWSTAGTVCDRDPDFCQRVPHCAGYRCRRGMSGSDLFHRREQNGKRTALIYLVNDLFGMIFWGTAFYAANAVLRFGFMDQIMTPVSVAFINTVFRVATVCVLFPFIPKLEKLVCMLVKDTQEDLEEEADLELLEDRLIDYPALAMGQCQRVISGMAKKVRKNVNRAMNLLNDYQQERFEKVQRKEDLIDKYETKLGAYLMKLTKRELTTAQSRQMSLYLSTISDFERIGDHAANIAYMSQELQESKMSFTSEALDELNVVMEAVREIMNTTAKAFMNGNQDEGSKVAPLGVVITNLCDELKHNHVMRLGSGACGLEQGTVFNDVLNSFTRIAAHCASIISAMQKAGEDNEDIHIHDSRVYAGEGMAYYTYFTKYSQKYDLKNQTGHVKSMEAEEIM